jgi:hypothetical protein
MADEDEIKEDKAEGMDTVAGAEQAEADNARDAADEARDEADAA